MLTTCSLNTIITITNQENNGDTDMNNQVTAANFLTSTEFMKIVFNEVFAHFAKTLNESEQEIKAAYEAKAPNVVKKVNEYIIAAAEACANDYNNKAA